MKNKLTALCFGFILVFSWSLETMAAVTEPEVNELLQQYDMTKEDLQTVLAEFGTNVEDFSTQEELADALDYYLNHLSEMKDLEEFFATIGLSESETDTLFAHLYSLDQDQWQQQMNAVNERLANFLQLDMGELLTTSQKNELSSIYTSLMNSFQLRPKYFLVGVDGSKTEITYNQLVNSEFTSPSLLVQLVTTTGEMIADVELSSDSLNPDFFVSSLEKLTNLGEMIGELPNTGSPYLLGTLLGVVCIISGIALLLIRKKLLAVWKHV